MLTDVAERCGEQRCGPAREARGRRPVEPRQDAVIGVLAMVLGLPERGASASPASRSLAKRTRHLLTTPRAHPTSRAIDRLPVPAAAASTILARSTKRCSVVLERTQPSSVARSSAVSTIGVAF